MTVKEGVVLDQNGTVVYDAVSRPTPVAWGAGGIIPKIILIGIAGALLAFGFGIASIVLVVMLASFVLRFILGFFFPSLRARGGGMMTRIVIRR